LRLAVLKKKKGWLAAEERMRNYYESDDGIGAKGLAVVNALLGVVKYVVLCRIVGE